MSRLKGEKMLKYLAGVASSVLKGPSDAYIRIAEVEYNKEFRRFVKNTGRRPTNEEAKSIMLG